MRTDRRLVVLLTALFAVGAGLVLLTAGAPRDRAPPPAIPSSLSGEERAAALAVLERDIRHLRLMRHQFRWGIENLQRNLAYVRYQEDRLQDQVERVFGPAPADHPLLAELAMLLARLPEQQQALYRAETQVRARLAALEADLAVKEAAFAGDAVAAMAGF